MLCSCTVREFLELVSEIIQEYEDENDFVNLFCEALLEEKQGVFFLKIKLKKFNERMENYLTLKANADDGSSEIPWDQMPKKEETDKAKKQSEIKNSQPELKK